jgi:hypothetical protein
MKLAHSLLFYEAVFETVVDLILGKNLTYPKPSLIDGRVYCHQSLRPLATISLHPDRLIPKLPKSARGARLRRITFVAWSGHV